MSREVTGVPDAATPYAIEILGVSKRYGDVVALSTVDIDIRQGEFVVLLGPSGCGKSTLLKIIAGLEDATEGEVWIGDRLANYLRPGDRDVAMVFQNYALYPHMTVETNIGFPLATRKRPKEQVARRVREVAQLLGLTGHLAKYPDQLSGGQRQRVALGRAIIREPVAFLMDEPLSNLDALLRVQMRTELLQLHRRVGRTTIYVTHDQVEAMTMADRIVVMREGSIEQIGPPAEVYAFPTSTFVATFVGSPPMNLLRGAIRVEDGAFRFEGPVAWDGVPGLRWPAGGASTLGIRPEHISITDPGAQGSVPGLVALVEDVGADAYVSVQVGTDTNLWVRTGTPALAQEGDRVGLMLDATHVRWFDEAGIRQKQEGS